MTTHAHPYQHLNIAAAHHRHNWTAGDLQDMRRRVETAGAVAALDDEGDDDAAAAPAGAGGRRGKRGGAMLKQGKETAK